jgi:hypothetical protein
MPKCISAVNNEQYIAYVEFEIWNFTFQLPRFMFSFKWIVKKFLEASIKNMF